MYGIYWQGRSIEDLDTREMQIALRDAVRELHFAKQGTTSDAYFKALITGFGAGAATVLLAIGVGAFVLQ